MKKWQPILFQAFIFMCAVGLLAFVLVSGLSQ